MKLSLKKMIMPIFCQLINQQLSVNKILSFSVKKPVDLNMEGYFDIMNKLLCIEKKDRNRDKTWIESKTKITIL